MIEELMWEMIPDGRTGYYQIGRDNNGIPAGFIYCPCIPEVQEYVNVYNNSPKSQTNEQQK